ncbi:MAG: proline--tRNA ligase [Alphaproteobacteria bacterium]|nr:proline--tRNA ligase [Alphaproteobacteria bacterium]
MRRTGFLIPTVKETAQKVEMISHQRMLQLGMIAQVASGLYSWLPLGLRVLNKVAQVVREEQNNAACQEVLTPLAQPLSLWEESGRADAYGKELLTMQDRHDNTLLFSPTGEEMMISIFSRYLKSYKDMPQCFYQIQWKFRDEIRPRHGVMRSREFLMKDAYAFDVSPEAALERYYQMVQCYMQTFDRLGITCIPVKADSGPIGGNYSHEFVALCDTGESTVYCSEELLGMVQDYQKHNPKKLLDHAGHSDGYDASLNWEEKRGIEVGHIFYFGDKYSKDIAMFQGSDNTRIPFEMGSYGIGISRVVAALIECYNDDKGVAWPEEVAPFKVCLVALGMQDEKVSAWAEEVYAYLTERGVDLLYDDRSVGTGRKLGDAELLGSPYIFIIGSQGASNKTVEIRNRATGEVQHVTCESAWKVCA